MADGERRERREGATEAIESAGAGAVTVGALGGSWRGRGGRGSPSQGMYHGISRKRIKPIHDAAGTRYRLQDRVAGESAAGASAYHVAPEGTISSPLQEHGRPIYRAKPSGYATGVRDSTEKGGPGGARNNVGETWKGGSVDKRDAIYRAGAWKRRETAVPARGDTSHRAAARRRHGTAVPVTGDTPTWNSGSSDKRCDIPCGGTGATRNGGSRGGRRGFLRSGVDASR
ncbi:hypothetical protein CERSUDRAFT_71725 [Gelatoporia subvermispora B]|uniref:Uncharacterized protein n=1 Tax=Ceriporiopsis subvermispora (strain B) TaxID=914234 RepID=M2RLY7_CERS8|nr:hypothetical protein CERSUDRAFT_71725 [Gelatoporia subvermispora B]